MLWGQVAPRDGFYLRLRAEPMWRGRVKMEGPPALTEPGVTSSATGPLGGGREGKRDLAVKTVPRGRKDITSSKNQA